MDPVESKEEYIREETPAKPKSLIKIQMRKIQQENEKKQAAHNQEIDKLRQAFREKEQEQQRRDASVPPLAYKNTAKAYRSMYFNNTKHELSPTILTNYIQYQHPHATGQTPKNKPIATTEQHSQQILDASNRETKELFEALKTNETSSAGFVRQRMLRYGLDIPKEIVADLLSLEETELSLDEVSQALEVANTWLETIEPNSHHTQSCSSSCI